MEKLTIKFIHCEQCNQVFLAGPSMTRIKMACGAGCGGELNEISKQEAYRIAEEKTNDNR